MHNLKICSLNVRGLKNKINRKALFKTLKPHEFDITAMQETYINEADKRTIEKELNGVLHFSCSTGRSKGLITHFSKNIKEENITLLETTDRVIISKVQQPENVYFVINVYAPCAEQDKILFYKNLERKIKNLINNDKWGSILCLGDFNCVVSNELDIVSGKKHAIRTVKAFNQFLKIFSFEDKLREFNEENKIFTWSNKDLSSARRLDYIFSGSNFNEKYMKAEIKCLPFTDHRAVTLEIKSKNSDRGSGLFKIDTLLFQDKDYIKIITETVNETMIKNNGLNHSLLWELIKINVKEKSMKYAKFKQQVKFQTDQSNRRELSILEKELIKNPSNTSILNKIMQIKKDIELKLIEDTKSASLRAGVKWIEQGEKNNKYFLGLEKTRVARNNIDSLKRDVDSTDTVTDKGEILDEIRYFYGNLYSEKNSDENILKEFTKFKQGLKIPQLTDGHKEILEKELTISEMFDALKLLNTGSSPGLDGIPSEFYKVFWDVIKKPLFDNFIYSFNTGLLALSQRKGVLTLLYKGNNSDKELLKNWRPISLVNSDYKILTKLFSIRIKKVIGTLVHDNQTGFIKGRNISQTLRELDDIIEREKSFKKYTLLTSRRL